jgi:hypothetical protein
MGEDTFKNHNIGLLVNSGNIEPQYAGNNVWAGNYDSWAALHFDPLNAGISERLYFSPTTALPVNHPSTITSPSNWFLGLAAVITDCCDDNNFNSYCASLPPLPYSNMVFNGGNFPVEQQWQSEANIYGQMMADPKLQNESPDAAKFFKMKENSSTAQLYQIRAEINDFWQQNMRTSAMGDLINQKRRLMDDWAVADSLRLTAQTPEDEAIFQNQIETVRNNMEQNTDKILEISVQLRQAQEELSRRLLDENAQIKAECTPPKNEQMYNDVWLRTKFFNRTDYDENQVKTLEYLAFQCPLQGGQSVYKARSLYAEIKDRISYDDDALCNTNRKSLSVAGTENIIVGIYPNPAKDEVYVGISGNVTQACRLDWYDMLGRLVQSDNLPASDHVTTTHTVNIKDLSNGIYEVLLNENGKRLYGGKLIISK